MINQLGASGSGCAAAPPSVSVVRGVAIAALLLSAAPCMALECPSPQPAGAAGAIQETPAQINELSQVLASGDLGNRIPIFVHSLRSRHPNAATGDLVNYLVTAYCPVVNSLTGLSNGEKQAKLKANYPIVSGVTPTAGGVVFFGDVGGYFYAVDAANGRRLWGQKIGGAIGGGVITYTANGAQKVAVATGLISPAWPVQIATAKVVILGLEGGSRSQ